MDYHSNRFHDFSLMVYKNDKLFGLLPANVVGNTLYSHQGLTYGGFLINEPFEISECDAVFKNIVQFLKKKQISSFEIKILPDFYQKKTTKTILDYLSNSAANNIRTEKVLAIDYSVPLSIHKTKLKHYKKNLNKGFEIKEETELCTFWNRVLIPRLQERHNVKPVHSLEEINNLKLKFPENIRQFNIYLNGTILAGITIFDKGEIVKSQYGATTKLGEAERALEFLFIDLIYKFKQEGRLFFSMGTVRDKTKPKGINQGLLRQKEELGCAVFYQHFYKFDII